jgi:thiosulfate/3-mercaptopyruvate sulfurtransferase
VEPVDRRAGHIPGSVNVPFAGNVGPDLRFLPPEQLRARFAAVGVVGAQGVACYCGSGVTATHDVLAMEVAGLGTPALYPGSWSEWSWPQAARPIVAGPANKA